MQEEDIPGAMAAPARIEWLCHSPVLCRCFACAYALWQEAFAEKAGTERYKAAGRRQSVGVASFLVCWVVGIALFFGWGVAGGFLAVAIAALLMGGVWYWTAQDAKLDELRVRKAYDDMEQRFLARYQQVGDKVRSDLGRKERENSIR